MIYFMQSTDGGPVKIGFTGNLEVRHRQLENHYGRRLVVLATMDGDVSTEREIHGRFDHIRLTGPRRRGPRVEQFKPTSEISDFINVPVLCGANPDAIEAMNPAKFDPNRNDRATKIDSKILGWAEMVAKANGISVAEYLSETLRVPVARDFAAAMKEVE